MTDGDAQPAHWASAPIPSEVELARQPSVEVEHGRPPFETLELLCFCALPLYLLGCCVVALFAVLFGPSYGPSNIRSTALDAATLRQAMVLFRAENADAECPSVDDLIEGQYLDPSMRIEDAWGEDFRLKCDGRDVYAVSAGPDGEFGSADDLD